MSTDEDTELRDLVVKTLETNGILGRIKAELRASVFLSLGDDDQFKKNMPLANSKFTQFASSCDGKKFISLVREFLEFFDLRFTLSVFDPEVLPHTCLTRAELIQEFGLSDVQEGAPLISELLKVLPKSISKTTEDSEEMKVKFALPNSRNSFSNQNLNEGNSSIHSLNLTNSLYNENIKTTDIGDSFCSKLFHASSQEMKVEKIISDSNNSLVCQDVEEMHSLGKNLLHDQCSSQTEVKDGLGSINLFSEQNTKDTESKIATDLDFKKVLYDTSPDPIFHDFDSIFSSDFSRKPAVSVDDSSSKLCHVPSLEMKVKQTISDSNDSLVNQNEAEIHSAENSLNDQCSTQTEVKAVGLDSIDSFPEWNSEETKEKQDSMCSQDDTDQSIEEEEEIGELLDSLSIGDEAVSQLSNM